MASSRHVPNLSRYCRTDANAPIVRVFVKSCTMCPHLSRSFLAGLRVRVRVRVGTDRRCFPTLTLAAVCRPTSAATHCRHAARTARLLHPRGASEVQGRGATMPRWRTAGLYDPGGMAAPSCHRCMSAPLLACSGGRSGRGADRAHGGSASPVAGLVDHSPPRRPVVTRARTTSLLPAHSIRWHIVA
jgi:hypothetical protein